MLPNFLKESMNQNSMNAEWINVKVLIQIRLN